MITLKQHDERDCGAACLSMIASHYDLKYPISKYRELTKTDQNGVNLYGLCDAAKKIGFSAEALSGTMEELLDSIQKGEIKFPFIAHIINEDYMQHFVVVLNIKNNKFVIADPAKGKIKYTFEQFAQLWNGYVVTFEKTIDFQKGNFTKGSFKKFFSLLKGQYAKLTTVIILSLIISIIGIIGAFIFEVIIDDFYIANETTVCDDDCTDEHDHITEETIEDENIFDKAINLITNNASNFNLFFICLIALYVLQSAIQFSRGYLISLVSKKIDMRLMIPYYNHIIDLPMSAVNTRKTGEYLSRFSDADAVRNAVSGATLTLLLDSFMVIMCGVILYMVNSILFYISLVIIVLYAGIVLIYKKPLESINRNVMENNARVQSYLKESIDGIETVKAHRMEAVAKNKNATKFTQLINSVFNSSLISISQDSICGLIELIGTVIILWVGFGMVLSNHVTIGSLITFYALLAYFIAPIKNLIELQPLMQAAVIAAERLNDILDIPPEDKGVTQEDALSFDCISFANVDFRYGNHELVLRDVSFEIKKGEKIAIVGESGCGKTTLAKLLLKFYSPESGQILFGGQELNFISSDWLRNHISYIDQSTFLFSDTIKNNLLLANPSATDKEIEEACKLANADDFISELPFGYDTFLDENGKNLSGGQRQRLAIARALLRNPQIIIFDEATSNLDTITESAIKDTIFNLNREMTCIIIAHRLSTIRNCDKIIVMEKGQIIEVGNHHELMMKKSKYFDLYNRQ